MSIKDDIIQPASDSFWEVDGYKRTVKRHEDGHKMCGDLMQLIQERADLEKAYAKSLRSWSSKWTNAVEKGPEYGTTEGAYKSIFEEAQGVASLHENIKFKLIQDVQSQIKQWRVENYTKPMVGAIKENKELEDNFKKAQKPWSKKLLRVMKCKKEYYTACKQEKTATNNENNARGDSTISQDQLKKLQDRVDKCKAEVERTKNAYEGALKEITNYRAQYMENMTDVYMMSDSYEEKRLKFFKEMLYGVAQSLDLSCTNDYQAIYESCYKTIDLSDDTKDLRWWAQSNGKDMPMSWPEFEDYSPEHRSITGKRKNTFLVAGDGGGITLTAIQRNDDSLPANTNQGYDNGTLTNSITNHTDRIEIHDSEPNSPEIPYLDHNGHHQHHEESSPTNNDQNPFGDEDWNCYEYMDIDETKAVPVRAEYDYKGEDSDELSFKAGEVFTRLKDANEQGWCTGKKDCKIGLYPQNYAVPIEVETV